MTISIFAMLYANNDIWILPAAIFTIAFFVLWLQENIYGFYAWKEQNHKKLKKDFQIFRDYADEFAALFRNKNKK